MIAKISILISIVISTINVILLMRLYQNEYDDEEMYRWGVAIHDKDGKVIFCETVIAPTSEEAITIARAKAGVVEGDGHKGNCVGPFE